ncbi:glycosyltransferase family A protein [uncultured Ornithinimicrobium sp.]|uniref:glycosyltransferase family A protein n=1 Tax=uncultured Ornithinimicrobium sp. TaxID=259307 RepID=UPI002597A1E0|nr:glycosyltransferase family A protein [uncultured Ornithinimicrobium sp.]
MEATSVLSARLLLDGGDGGAPARDRAARLLAVALRGRHPAGLEALALTAGFRRPSAAVAAALLDGEPLPAATTVPGESLPFTVALATAWAATGETGGLAAAVEVYRQVVGRHGPGGLRPVEQRHYLQAAYLAGRTDLVHEGLATLGGLTADVAEGLRADLLNPYVRRAGDADGAGAGGRPVDAADHQAWVAALGSRFRARDLLGPQVDPSGACLFDGLHLGPARSVDGPLVTVVVPAFRPDAGLLTSVRSVLAQSYGQLEVVVVDDASGPGFAAVFEAVAALDDRVRLLRQDRNGGAYVARNRALAEARGELVTTQDADDWSHPERLARQVAALTDHPEAVASRSAAVRARPDLTRQWFGYRPERMNASSLLVRREVFDRVGPFDTLRKGADSEFAERLRLVGPVQDVVAPLAITRLAAGSLSRADFAWGWHHPDRVLFRNAFRDWHRRVRAGEAALPLERKGPRPYAVPRRFRVDRDPETVPVGDPVDGPSRTGATGGAPSAAPLVLLADAARPVPSVLGDGLAALAAADGGLPAVLVREDLTRAGAEPEPYDEELLAEAAAGHVELLTDADEMVAGTLLVLDPALLGPPALPLPELRAGEALVAAVPPSADEPVRDLEQAGEVVRTLTGRAPVWVARTPGEQQAWAADGWRLPLLGEALADRGHRLRPPGTGGGATGTGGGAPQDLHDRLVGALELVAEIEEADAALPRRTTGRELLVRDRVARVGRLDPRVEPMVPPPLRGAWSEEDPAVRSVTAPVAADVVVLGKLDLADRVKLRAAYPEAGLVLAAQPAGPKGECGITRSVRAHEVVARHAPGLAPRMVSHGRTGSGVRYLVEELVEGRPLGSARALDARAAELLTALAGLHAGHGTRRTTVRQRWGDGMSRRWAATVGTGIVPDGVAGRVAELLGRDADTLRVSWSHGDLVPSNVFAGPDGLTLLDWEHSQEAPVMHDAAKLHLFCGDPAALLDVVAEVLGVPRQDGRLSGAEELVLAHAQLVGRYPERRDRMRGHPRAEVYERQVRRQVDRLAQVVDRCDGSW